MCLSLQVRVTLLLGVVILILELSAELRLCPRGLAVLPSGLGPAGLTRPRRVLRVLRGEVEVSVLLLTLLGLWDSGPGSRLPF